MTNERAADPQLAALRAFTFLTSLRTDWGGALIVACGLDAGGEQFAIASNIAGAGCLAIDSRPEVCRATLRSGASDFVVNSVDEALRILKNEIRKHQAVSVALSMDVASALAELLGRGVQPEMFAAFGGSAPLTTAAAHRFSELGAIVVDFGHDTGIGLDANAELDQFTSQANLSLAAIPASTAEQLRTHDTQLLALVPSNDPRRRWFASAPRFFHRERPPRRLAYLTSVEREKLGA
jgi:urocanate hydratase